MSDALDRFAAAPIRLRSGHAARAHIEARSESSVENVALALVSWRGGLHQRPELSRKPTVRYPVGNDPQELGL